MHDRENLTIGVLSVTATVLFVGAVLVLATGQNQLMAAGDLDRGGDYVMVTGQYTLNNALVYITDAAANRLNVYSYDRVQRQLRLWDSHDLRRVFGEAKQ